MGLATWCKGKFHGRPCHDKHIEISEPDPELKKYYNSLETRLTFKLLLGNTKHHGWYDRDTKWPFPISAALRTMEDHLVSTLDLAPGARVLDAGSGDGQGALTLARWGMNVEGVDIISRHVANARKNVAAAHMDAFVNIRQCSFQALYPFGSETFDGVYAMESLVQATDLRKTIQELYRVMKPGGHLALHDYDLGEAHKATADELKYNNLIRRGLAVTSLYPVGAWETLLAEARFESIIVRDITRYVYPMLRMFALLAYAPYLVYKCLGIEKHIPNTVLAVKSYQHVRRGIGFRFLSIEARKPICVKEPRVVQVPEVWVTCGDEKGGEKLEEVKDEEGTSVVRLL